MGLMETISSINRLINTPNTRKEGLINMIKFLRKCNLEILQKSACGWIRILIKSCNPSEIKEYHNLIYTALKLIGENCYECPILSKQFSSSQFTKCFQILEKVPLDNSLSVLECIECLLRLYSTQGAPYENNIINFLIKFTDIPDDCITILCAKCHYQLLLVKGGGLNGSFYRESWTKWQTDILGNLDSILNEMLISSGTFNPKSSNESHKIRDLDKCKEPTKRAIQLYIRFHNLLKYLNIAISKPYPVTKSISISRILNLITSVLSISVNDLKYKPISDRFSVTTILSNIHIDILELLETLIYVLGNYLKEFCSMILISLVNLLKVSSVRNASNAVRTTRMKVYKILEFWLSITNFDNDVEDNMHLLVDELFKDISCNDDINSEMNTKIASECKNRISVKPSQKDQHKISIVALSCLQKFLLSSSNIAFLKHIKIIHYKVIELCVAMMNKRGSFYLLHSNWEYRFQIYLVLQTILYSNPAQVDLILKILQNAYITEQHCELKAKMHSLLIDTDKLMHPRKGSLHFSPATDPSIVTNQNKLMFETLVIGLHDGNGKDCNEMEQETNEEIIFDNNLGVVTEQSHIHESDESTTYEISPAKNQDQSEVKDKKRIRTTSDNDDEDVSKQLKLTIREENDDEKLLECIAAEFIDDLSE